jgi:hypothetical protein
MRLSPETLKNRIGVGDFPSFAKMGFVALQRAGGGVKLW